MDPLLAALHLIGFVAPAFGIAALAAGLAKLVWWGELRAVRWRRLAGSAGAACLLVSIAGLLGFGHDGKMATYAGMVVACAVVLWWVGFRTRG